MHSKIVLPVLLGLLLLTLAACSCKNVFVLLPDSDGTVGSFELSNEKGSVVVDKAGKGVTVAYKDSAPTAAPTMSPEEITKIFKEALIAEPLSPKSFLLYFKKSSTQLTIQSSELIPQILKCIKERQSVDISVIGHTDTMGSKKVNFTLAAKRAGTIRDFLISKGMDGQLIQADSHGEGNLLVPTGDEISEPKNRRVEVIVR